MKNLSFALLVYLLISSSVKAQQSAFTVKDIINVKSLSAQRLSKDGTCCLSSTACA